MKQSSSIKKLTAFSYALEYILFKVGTIDIATIPAIIAFIESINMNGVNPYLSAVAKLIGLSGVIKVLNIINKYGTPTK